MEEDDDIPFQEWEGVDEYQDPVYHNLLSVNFVAVFLEVPSLLNSRV